MKKSPLDHYIELESADQHIFRAYVAAPLTPVKAAVVILQEMDQRGLGHSADRTASAGGPGAKPGVNAYVRAVAKSYANEGYLAIAPSTFSRGRSGRDYGYLYDESQHKAHPRIVRPLQALASPLVMLDIQAAIDFASMHAESGQVGVVGFCWGGLLAWRAAGSMNHVAAAVCYYGGGMTGEEELVQATKCPVMAHMGQDNIWMSRASIEAFEAARQALAGPPVEVHRYDASYGFDNPQRNESNKTAALLARQRTRQFLKQHLGT
jgi:carboxymethylenebutenolidase